jgi:hypothetical protein
MASSSNATISSKCPGPMKATSQGAFQGENPLDYALPLAILQICLVVVVTRGLAYLLRPLRQPRVIAEIIVSSTFPSSSLLLTDRSLGTPPVGFWVWGRGCFVISDGGATAAARRRPPSAACACAFRSVGNSIGAREKLQVRLLPA